ncbi:MAG: Nitrilase/cyanide hydratase and apolipoprotein N-acyltransferase [Bacteroidetes bacterium]|nr:Nitrilase/cyanide hydratase and apolipoprotein N-acyltransferase [Bacteroidota bacterium]
MTDLRIATIQTALHWENVDANLKMFDGHLRSISAVDLIVLPEMFSTGFSMDPIRLSEGMDGSAVAWMRKAAREKNYVISGSLMLYEGDGEARKYYNRLIWMRPDGSYETYDKKHLFSLSQEPKIYTAGNRRLIVTLNGWRICPMICYDLRFPVWSRNAINANREADYDILTYSANWPDKRALAWRTLLQARAIENLSYVVGVNRIGEDGTGFNYLGESSVIDPLGAILYRKENVEDITTITLSYDELIKIRRQFTFLKDADAFELK